MWCLTHQRLNESTGRLRVPYLLFACSSQLFLLVDHVADFLQVERMRQIKHLITASAEERTLVLWA